MRKATSGISAQVIVVDNASTDGSQAFFQDRFEEVTFIWNDTNTGFAKANNAAYELATGDCILFLNPDTILAEDTLKKCIDYLKDHPEAGALGVRMIDGTGCFLKESKRSFPDPLTSFYKLSGLTKLFPKSSLFGKYYAGNVAATHTGTVDVIAGAYFMVRRKILEATGVFDEAFFMYGEDIDLSYRIQKAGYQNVYFADTTIIHFKGESTKRGSVDYVKMFYKAMDIFARKHHRKGGGIYHAMIQGGIFLRGSMSIAYRGMHSMIKTQKFVPKETFPEYVVVVGSNKTDEEIIKNELPALIKVDFVSVKNDVFNTIEDITSIIEEKKTSGIIFLEGAVFSYKEIIAVMQLLNKKQWFYIYSSESSSIIGSHDNTLRGHVILIDRNKNRLPFRTA